MNRGEQLSYELNKIVKILIDEYKVEKIILFGSLAKNEINEWSDIDLIVIKDTDKPFYERLEEVIEIVKPDIGVDIIVYTPEEVEEMRESLFYTEEVLKKGKIIYERSKSVA
ncbi:nucleotidyltransferase domain-containing protein [Thermoanaerobacterium thermosaccharolyticum]|jgi:predicted nucleotidyltransferase|uniref:nucleotidyltransferase domain-containing protein n=1 Tax=Thermoanaerobacterium thermosaccharolyticum TaxID=1517 RepID=UPI00104422A1|nr:nucleotidyltransferase domain-containing protein [Thermoanaerobacterium thermosaccharolyticum]KAA5806901.1 nucleotidyltransferase domain-containing protein [Thermoanaerobacterium thermosaccharolyticum]TCW42571.1 nucleotidyltransferase-like protein [Thermohydrogenium kirishiense]